MSSQWVALVIATSVAREAFLIHLRSGDLSFFVEVTVEFTNVHYLATEDNGFYTEVTIYYFAKN